MTVYGLTPTGFLVPTLEVLVDAFVTPLREAFGASQDFGPTTTEGQIITVLSNALAQLWETLQAVVAAGDPAAATGVLLEAIAAITGTFKRPATASTVTLTLTGVDGTTISQASQARTASTLALFGTDASATLVALDAWAITTAYALGDRVTNASRAYQAIAAGTSAGSGGPTTTNNDITDGTVHWRYLGEGEAAVDVGATALVTGATVALSGDATEIATPVFGWDSVINLEDANLGAPAMTNEGLRVLRDEELAGNGRGTVDAIRAAMLDVSGVTACTVFFNDQDVTDADGVTPHALEVLVTGGADQDIIDALWIAGGGRTFVGTTSGYTTDAAGAIQGMKFSRPEDVNIYVRASIIYFPSATALLAPIVPVYPDDGDTQVANAILAYGATLPVGRDVSPRIIGGQVDTVDGVLDVVEVLAWTSPIDATPAVWAASTGYTAGDQVTRAERQYVCITTGTSDVTGPLTTGTDIIDGTAHWRYLGAPIVIGSRQRADLDSSRIDLVKTVGAP